MGKRFTERDIIDWLDSPSLSLGPVALKRVTDAKIQQPRNREVDGLMDAFWQGRSNRFVIEIKTLGTPQSIENAINTARRNSYELRLSPMVVVPYLNRGQLAKLDQMGISGIDMCGNGLIAAPDFRVWEAGNPNLYPEPTTLKNPYSGDSSIFARCFLLRRKFESLTELRSFAASRTLFRSAEQTELQMSTASKVVRALSEELIVTTVDGDLELADRQLLVEKFTANYNRRANRTLVGTTPLAEDEVWSRLRELRKSRGLRSASTGIGSARFYGVLSGADRTSLYVDDLAEAAKALEFTETRSFANIELFEAERNLSFFDTRESDGISWASPIQTWLELLQAGPREAEAAESMSKMFALT